jgi:hypothetical protein
MTLQVIDIGVQGNDGTGDSIRASFQKVNSNFNELYAVFGLGGKLAFPNLSDGAAYTANQLIMGNTTGSGLSARTIVSANAGLTINTSDPTKITFTSSSPSLAGDPTPTLGQHLNANTLTIGRLADPSAALVTAFNNAYASLGVTTTLAQLAVTKGYADANYLAASSTVIGGNVTAYNISTALKIRNQPTLPQTSDADYNPLLTSNYLSTEAMQRKDTVYRGGDTMTGALTLSDHPTPLSGAGVVNNSADLQAASKYYVDNNTYYSGINLYVSTTKGDDTQKNTPSGRQGRAWQYAYKTVGAAALQAQNLITLSGLEPGPYKQRIAYTVAPTQYSSQIQSITLSGGNSADSGYTGAANLLELNKAFIQAETIAYLNKKYVNSFTFSKTRWATIIQNIVNGVGYDLAVGSTYNSTTQASILFNSYNSDIITTQLTQIIDGINYAKNQILGYSYSTANLQTYVGLVIDAICYDLLFSSNFQTVTIAQQFSKYNVGVSTAEIAATLTYVGTQLTAITSVAASSTAIAFINSAITTMNAVIQAGTAVTPVWPALVAASSSAPSTIGQTSARDLLYANITFIQTEIVAYLLANFSSLSYSSTTCQRDVKLIVEALIYDLMYGGNSQSVYAGLRYWIGNTLQVQASEQTATVAAMNYIGTLAQAIVTNTPPATLYQQSVTQYINSTLSGNNTATAVFSSGSTSSITLVVTTGLVPISAGQTVTGTGFTGGQTVVSTTVSGALTTVILSAVPNTQPAGTITFTSKVLGSLSSNIATIAGIVGSVSTPSPVIVNPTVSAAPTLYQTMRTDIQAQKITIESAAVTYVNNNFPVINDSGITTTISNLFTGITNLLSNGIGTRTTPIYTDPSFATSPVTHARTAILANVAFIKAETTAWITANYPTLSYNSSTLLTLVNSILESICYDITYGGNSATTAAAYQYYNNVALQISGTELAATVAAINHVQTIAIQIAGNTAVSPTFQSGVTQTFNNSWTDGGATATTLNTLFNEAKDIIANNTVYTYVYPVLTSYTSNLQSAQAIIATNASTIATATTSYLAATYTGGFNYNQTTCSRDVGLIIDAMVIDLLTAGTYQSISAGLSYYSNTSAKAVAIGTQLSQTVDGIQFAETLALQVLNQTTATRYQYLVTQVINGSYTASAGAISTFTTNMTTVLNIIKLGYGAAPSITTSTFGTGIYTLTITNGGNGYVDQGSPGDVHIIPAKILIGANSAANGIIVSYSPGTGTGVDTIVTRMVRPGFFQCVPTTATGTINTTSITVASATYTNIYTSTITVGMGVSGGGIPLGATVTAVNGTVISISSKLSATITNGSVVFGEQMDFGETVKNLNITIRVESGIYYEDMPIKLPANCSISGDEFRRTIIRPLDRISQSPWRTIFFYRDSVIDAIQTGLLNFATDYASATTLTLGGTSGNITATLGAGQAAATWVGLVLMDATSETGTAGKAVVTSVAGNVLNCTVIYPFASAVTYTSGNWHLYGTINYGRHYLTNPLDITSTPLNNKLMDVFLCNDATRITGITFQGHGGFAMVLDPEGQIKTKSPYGQVCSSFSQSINAKAFRGGQFVDGFTGRLFGNITAVANSSAGVPGITITVTGAVNSGLDIRAPQSPSVFYIAGNRYQIDDVPTWNAGTYTAVLTLDVTTPFNPLTIYNTGTFVNSSTYPNVSISGIIDAVTFDLVTGSNYQSVKTALAYLQPANAVIGIQQLFALSGITKSRDLSLATINNGTDITAITASYAIITNALNNGISTIPTATFPVLTTTTANVANAVTILQANKAFIQAEIVAYIASNFIVKAIPNYSAVTLSTRIGYAVDAITYDLLYGGNTGAFDGASSYYLGGDQITGQESYYTAAFGRVSAIVQLIVQNQTVTSSAGNLQLQNKTAATAATSAEATTLAGLVGIYIDYVADGTFNNSTIATTVGGTNTLTNVPYNSLIQVGATVSGANIPNGTTVSNINNYLSSGTITISNNVTGTATSNLVAVSFGGTSVVRSTPALPVGGSYTQVLADRSTIQAAKPATLTTVTAYLNAGANLPINIEMGGNRSMLANDFAMVNDLAYAVVVTNGGASEQVSTFSYYCHTHYWSINGGQIRSVAGSNAHGDYGLRATGYDVTELPNAVNMSNDMVQTARIYKQGVTAGYMTPTATTQALTVYIIGWEYIPYSTSELEIDHSLSGGGVTRYLISTVGHTTTTINGQNVLQLQLSTIGTNSTSTTGLLYALYDGQVVTIRALQNIKFYNISNVKPTRPSTAVQYTDNLADIYRVIVYNLTESTGEALGANIAILGTDASFAYYLFTTDGGNIINADPAYDATATILTTSAVFQGYITASILTVGTLTSGTVAIGQIISGAGITAGTYISAGSGSTWTVVGTTSAGSSGSQITITTGGGNIASSNIAITSFVATTGVYAAATNLVGSVLSGTGFSSQVVTAVVNPTGSVFVLTLSAAPTIIPGSTVTFSSKTQGFKVSDNKISVLQISNTSVINQINKGIYLFGWSGRVHRVISYTSPTAIAGGFVSAGGTGTYTLVVTGVSGTIVPGMVVIGTGFNSTQFVQTVGVVGSTATITLTAYPSATPSGTLQFGTVVSGYLTIDPNPIYNNAADGTAINSMTYLSTAAGLASNSLVTYAIPYRLAYPAVDSFMTISGQSNSNYNGNYQVANVATSTLVTVSSNTTLAVGMVVTTIAAGAYVPPYCIIQSLVGSTQFIISPAAWLPAGTSVSATAVATVQSVTITNGGSGYTTAPTITFSGGNAITQAQATCTISNGGINLVTITSPGYGYTSIPTITLSQVLGGAVLTPVLSSTAQVNATVSTGVNTTQVTVSYPTAPGLSGNATASTHAVGNLGSGPTVTGTTLTAGAGASGLVVGMVIAGVTPVSGSAITYISAFLGGSGGAGTYTLNQSVTGTPTSATLDVLTVSSVANLYVGATITFTGTVANPVFGNIVSGTTYYVSQIVSASTIGISATNGGSNFTLATVASGLTAYYAPVFAYGTSQTITGAGAPTLIVSGTYSGQYSVTYTFTGTYTPPTGVYYYVNGNSSLLFNGYAIASASVPNTSITLVYPYNPGTYGTGTTTFTRETTNASATTLGISKPFSTSVAFNPRLGYPQGEGAQITTKISTTRATGHDFLYIGTGSYTTTNWPTVIYGNPAQAANQSQEILEEGVGRVFYVTTDQNGIFRVGRFFSVDQGTGSVTFSASIALSNLDGLGFKRGVVVAEFSTDSALTNNAADTVPVQSAIRSFVDRRLGLDYGGNPISSSTLIGPGYLALNGTLAMKANLNMALWNINNLANPTVSSDATNKLYVDTQVTSTNSLYKLKDVASALQGSVTTGNYLIYDAATNNNGGLTGGWRNIGVPTGDVNVTFNSGAGTLTTAIQANKIVNSMINSAAAIAQSKLAMQAAVTASSAPGTFTQASLGLAEFDSVMFTATNGWITLAASTNSTTGIVYSKLQYVSAGTILGNRTGVAAAPSEMTPVQVVTDGNAVSNASFSTVGAMTVVSNANSTFNSVTNTGGGNTYAVTTISVTNAANTLVKSASDKSVDVGSLKVSTFTALTYVSGTSSIAVTTPGGQTVISATGTSSSNAVTTITGTLDTSTGTIKATAITTGAPASTGTIVGQWSVQAASQIDYTLGTLKSITLTTGADSTVGTIQGAWSLTGASRLQATYADLAEFYEGDQDYKPGTVLVFGGDKEVTTTTVFNDTRSAGVVTTNPAYVMNAEQTGIKVCLALAGRVPVKVVGKVKKGDMLTTSATPGYAVKATDPKLGSIIGKALEDKEYTEAGIIQVAVGRV